MKFRTSPTKAASLIALTITAMLANTAVATESNVPLKQPNWAYDANIEHRNFPELENFDGLFGIHTLGVAINSVGMIHAQIWKSRPPYADQKWTAQLYDLGDYGQSAEPHVWTQSKARSAMAIDDTKKRAYLTTQTNTLLAVPAQSEGSELARLWESQPLDGWLSMPALSPDGETIYVQACKEQEGRGASTAVYYAFASDGKQKWRIDGVSGYNNCTSGTTPYAPVVDRQGRPYFTSYVIQERENNGGGAIETIIDTAEGPKRTGTLESYLASAPAIANDRLYFVAPTGKKSNNGVRVAALKSASVGMTLGDKQAVKTHFIIGNYVGIVFPNTLQSPVIAGNIAYVVDPYLGTVYALALNGENPEGEATELWRFQPPELAPVTNNRFLAANVSVTVSEKGTAYVTAGRHLHALNNHGQEEWRYKYDAITDENLGLTNIETGAGIRTVTLGKHGEVYATACKDNSDKCGLLVFDGDGSSVATPWGKVGGNAANTGHETEYSEVKPALEVIVGKDINVVATTSNGFAYKLDGSKSLNAVTYRWRKLNGPFSVRDENNAIAEAVVPKNTIGASTFELTVTDKDGKQLTAETTVTVVSPSVTISGPATTNSGQEVRLTAQANFKGAGRIAPTYSWRVLDSAGIEVLQKTSQQLDVPPTLKVGKFQIMLTASTTHGARQATANRTFEIKAKTEGDQTAPQAIVGNDITVVRTRGSGFAYKLDGSKSRNAVAYQWIKLEGNDGGIRNEKSAIAEAIVPKNKLGVLKYQLTVTSKDGRQDTTTIKLTSVLPTATITGPTSIIEGQAAHLTAQVNFKAANGEAPAYRWRLENFSASKTYQGLEQQFDLSILPEGYYLATLESFTQYGGRAASARFSISVNKAKD
ncbi:PKD domain-containing protein [Glaciimonas sp. GG7]